LRLFVLWEIVHTDTLPHGINDDSNSEEHEFAGDGSGRGRRHRWLERWFWKKNGLGENRNPYETSEWLWLGVREWIDKEKRWEIERNENKWVRGAEYKSLRRQWGGDHVGWLIFSINK
jgi:hypothetical protein